MADNSTNGNRPAAPAAKLATLQLTFEYSTFKLDIKGDAENYDVFMSMLQMAQRHFETLLRINAAKQFQVQSAEQQRVQQLAESVMRKV